MAINDAIAAGVDVNSRRNGKSALLRTIASDGKKVNLESARHGLNLCDLIYSRKRVYLKPV